MDIKLTDTALKKAVDRFEKASNEQIREALVEDLVFCLFVTRFIRLLEKDSSLSGNAMYQLYIAFLVVREAYRHGNQPGKSFEENELESLTICDCCGEEIPTDEANDGTAFDYGILCNECYAEAIGECEQ